MPYCGLTKAAKKLPEDCREAFKDAFNATGCMDLYSGYLPHYFMVIRQTLEQRAKLLQEIHEQLKPLDKANKKLRELFHR
jgi:hypothetical protein